MANNRSKAFTNANKRLPERITPLLIEGIQNLPDDGPKSVYLKEVFLEKFVSKDTAPPNVRRQRAINKWLATERQNEATNTRILITHPEFNILPGVEYKRFVEKARSVIESVLSPVPEWDSLIGSFSGGASTSRQRTVSHPANKYLGKAHVTEKALVIFNDLVEDMPGWDTQSLEIEIVPGNVLFTVPKNADIDRVACKEPDLNMFMQKGLGSAIRRSLKKVGIDLNDQSINKDLARQGSISNDLATLDLSSASDSVSWGLVEELLPPCWFTLLDSLRSPITIIDGEEHRNEMFSSMGNGFTFELESLLFYSLARTTAYFEGVSGVISVYGDDIIVPSRLSQLLSWVLGYFGFEVNAKKSFSDGPFRESCGGHFVNGLDVTPFYLRKPIDRLTDLIHILNRMRYWARPNYPGLPNVEIWELWSSLASFVPKKFWGGREYSSITQLVSPHSPRAILSPKKMKVEPHDGHYTHWLNATWRRVNPSSIETSNVKIEVPFYRARRAASTGTRLDDYFLEEVCCPPSST